MVNAKKRSDSTGVDASGSRVSTRSQSIRKSNRLEGRSPPITPLKKKSSSSAALGRSPGLNKRNGGGSGGGSGLKKCGSESGGCGENTAVEKEEVTAKAKRLDARRYREMFKPLKNVEGSGGKEGKDEESGGDGEVEEEKKVDDGKEDRGGDDEEVENEKVEDGKEDCGGDGEELEEKEKVEDGKEDCGGDLNDEGAPVSGAVVEKVEDGVTVSSSSGVVDLDEECDKCSRKRSLDHDSQEQELCCCLPNTVNDMDGYMDRGQGGGCAAEFSKEHDQNGKQCNSSFDVQGRICGACQCAGKLLHCGGKGCRRSYHPSCLSNHEESLYLLNWYCSECTKKKFLFGLHSVSQGIESILDVREVELSTEGKPKQKQYYVKYKGLAHIHNRWIPEILVLHVIPELHAKVGKLKEDTQWNPVWTVPHRLLQRRSVIIDDRHGKPTEQEVSLESVSRHEWLVKWCGLDYDQATWESEDSSFLKKLEAQRLIKEYETRHNKVQEKIKLSHTKIGRNSVGGADNYYHYFINKLRECHHRGHNAVLLDEQDRFVKLIHLVSSLAASVCRPFLIIAPHASLCSWEAEFTFLAPSINVVVYAGNEDARDIIRSVEFFEGDHLMLQVLISSAAAITEDADRLRGIEWEAVIIDDCQQSCILAHSDSIMNLATGWRLLLVNSQLEDNISEYINILCLLEPGYSFKEHPELAANSNETMNLLKEKLSPFIICARFLEYWVPVEMSNLQLEQYCFSLLSKSSVLRSISKSDPVGSLREILILLRKCCDHPYIVDMQLQNSLAYGLSYEAVMDLGIKASGKLHLLEKLLSELKNKERKVLILFQPAGGSGRDSTGNILDDFLRFRFGSDSYEHIESGLISSKKQTACNQFNSVKDRSFLLLETRACSPSIKLAFVDAVIIFDSDWNPLNDLRALQKITIDSKLDQIKIFRLYCPGTVEEKVLILAKNDVVLDNTLQIISPSTSHMLLMWGSSYLFSRLDNFHQNNISDCKDNIVFESSLSMDVTQEIVSLFQNRKISSTNKYISLAQQNGGSYSKSIALIGEQRILSDEGKAPHIFWPRLLEGLKPQWKYLSGSSQRNRKRVQYHDELTSVQNDEATKRRKKMDSTKLDSSSLQVEPRPETSIINSQSKGNTDPNSNKGHDSVIAEPYNLKKLHSEQRGLFELLKPTILQLCETLLLKDDGKRLVERFLGYLVKNYRVTKEPETRLQAFLLSVCWTAVEGLKQKIDHKMSVTIVREKLGFVCTENDTVDIYTKLKPIFSCSGIMNHHPAGDLSSGKAEEGFEKVKKRVEKGCDKKMKRLKIKHDEELKEFEKSWEDERMKLESWCKLESAGVRVSHANSSVGTDMLRALDNDYAKRRDALEKKISMSLRELEARQKVEREEEQEKVAGLMKRLNSLGHNSRGRDGVNSQLPDPVEPDKESNEHASNNGNLLEQQNSEREASRTTGAAIDLIASENLENIEKQRANCEIDDSLENIAASKGSGIVMREPEQPLINASENVAASAIIMEPPEQPTSENVTASKESGIIMGPPEQPCASTGQANKDTNLVIDVVRESSICLPSNQISEARRMESSSNLLTDSAIQAFGTESHLGVEEQVSDATCTNTNSSLDESSSLNRSDTGVIGNSTHRSMNGWVNSNRVADSSLVGQPNENDTSIGATTSPMHQHHTSSSTSVVTFSQSHPQTAIDQSVDTNFVPIGVVSSHANLQSQVQAPITSVPQAQTSLPDPLQMELERLHHEIVKVMNHHEGTKSQLKSEYDKEIEELVAQVKKKYEEKLNEAETSFSLKKTELEMCQHKVMMNKILAEAFRSKCTDYKAAPKTQHQGISSSSAESSSQSHHTRPVSASCPLSTMPASGQFNVAPPVQRVGPAMSFATQSRMAHINFGGAPMATQQQQVRHEAHAPASFIQAFRSSTPNFSSNVPSGSVPTVPVQNNPMSTSVLHLPSHTPQLPSSAQLNPHGRSHHEGSTGRGTPLGHLSNIELLRDIVRCNNPNDRQYSSNVPLFSDNLPNSQSWDISQFEEATDLQPPSSNLPAGNVVCLSDDE